MSLDLCSGSRAWPRAQQCLSTLPGRKALEKIQKVLQERTKHVGKQWAHCHLTCRRTLRPSEGTWGTSAAYILCQYWAQCELGVLWLGRPGVSRDLCRGTPWPLALPSARRAWPRPHPRDPCWATAPTYGCLRSQLHSTHCLLVCNPSSSVTPAPPWPGNYLSAQLGFMFSSRKPAQPKLILNLVKNDPENKQPILPRARCPKQKPELNNDYTARVKGMGRPCPHRAQRTHDCGPFSWALRSVPSQTAGMDSAKDKLFCICQERPS